jgi:hypothetical protein
MRPASLRLLAVCLLLGLAVAAWLNARTPAPVGGFDLDDHLTGYRPDPEGTRAFLAELGPRGVFAKAAPDAMAQAREVDTFLWRQMDKAHRKRYGSPFVVGRQGIGDCTAWGAMHAVFCAEAVSWDLGELPDAPLLPATEAIYGGARVESRGKSGDGASPVGGYSDGATGWSTAKFLRDWGVVYREPFPDLGYDLTTYSADRAKAWGAYGCGGQGDRGRLDAVAKRHPCRHVVAVKTWAELVAAVTSGFPVTIASSQGFASRTDASGVLPASGTWMHQMAVIGVRFKSAAPAGVRAVDAAAVINSWGTKWISYQGKYPADLPDGVFWAERPVIERILAQGDSYAIGAVEFKYRDIHHGDWLAPAPAETLTYWVAP